jgi:hypothetical protein
VYPAVYNLVVAGMVLSAMNSITERLDLSSKSIEQKDLTQSWVQNPVEMVARIKVFGCTFDTKSEMAFKIAFWLADYLPSWVVRPVMEKKPLDERVLPNASFSTANLAFNFRDGKLHLVMNTQTNIEAVEYYRAWAKMPSLVNSNEAYHMATNWLTRVYVDVAALNQKYKVSVGQPGFWMTPPAKIGEEGHDWTILPLYYVTWRKGDYEAAKVGIFGPTKQFMGLTIGDPDQAEDASICSHIYFVVTNANELLAMTNVPMRMSVTNYVPPRTNQVSRRRYPPPDGPR